MAVITRVRTIFTGVAGTPWYSNLYFDGDGDDQAYTDVVGDFWEAIAGNIWQQVLATVQDTVTHLDPATGNTVGVGSVDGHQIQGTNVAQPLPFSNQMLVDLRTGQFVGGREVRGRLNVPGVVAGDTSNGVFLAGPVAEVTAAADDVRTAVLEPDNFWLVWSRKNGAAYPVTSNAAQRKVAVLRSRRD